MNKQELKQFNESLDKMINEVESMNLEKELKYLQLPVNYKANFLCKFNNMYILGATDKNNSKSYNDLFVGDSIEEVSKCNKPLKDLEIEDLYKFFKDAILDTNLYTSFKEVVKDKIAELKHKRNDFAIDNKRLGFKAGVLDKRKLYDDEVDLRDNNSNKILELENQIKLLNELSNSIIDKKDDDKQLKLF